MSLKLRFKTTLWYDGDMVVFQDIEEVEEWLAPMDYVALWEAVAPYNVFTIAERDHCDGLIARGIVPQETILTGLKGMALTKLRDAFGLQHRRYDTHASQGIASLH